MEGRAYNEYLNGCQSSPMDFYKCNIDAYLALAWAFVITVVILFDQEQFETLIAYLFLKVKLHVSLKLSNGS